MFVFTMEDQRRFAALSGDSNPMHMDPVAARRTQAGAPAAHGVHVMLRCLEKLAEDGVPLDRLARIGVKFGKFVYLDQPFSLAVNKADSESLRASVTSADGVVLLTLSLKFGARGAATALNVAPMAIPPAAIAPTLAEMASMGASLTAPSDAAAFAAAFPHLSRAIGERRVAGLALTSTVVGMICPGLHSIYSSLDVDLIEDNGDDFWFRTTRVDDRFNLVAMDAGGAGISCRIAAFERRPPVATDSMVALSALVAPDEFAGMTALVLGGSRGLGAATAKLITAGGGRAIITYARGKADAESVAEEIRAARGAGACEIAPFDFHKPVEPQLAALPDAITHLFYFCTPFIARQKAPAFSHALFDEFFHAYADVFNEACLALRAKSTAGLRAFYPSTVYIDERPQGMLEYAMAKAAGEILCAELTRNDPALKIIAPRLPRVATDQTATVIPLSSEGAAATMLAHIRAIA